MQRKQDKIHTCRPCLAENDHRRNVYFTANRMESSTCTQAKSRGTSDYIGGVRCGVRTVYLVNYNIIIVVD